MKDFKINNDIYEQYVDASVALFMEHYASALTEEIREKINSTDSEDAAFPKELDERCRALLKKESTRQRRKQVWKYTVKGLRHVAVFAVALLSLASFLFVTVEAFRAPILDYYIKQGDGHWTIDGSGVLGTGTTENSVDLSDPLASVIPEEYKLVELDGDSLNKITAIYENTEGEQIYFNSTRLNGEAGLDSEDAQFSEKCELLGCPAIIVVENSVIRIAWLHEETDGIYVLITEGLTKKETIRIANEFIIMLSK